MEELGDSRNFHFHHDIRLLPDDCWRSTRIDDNSKKLSLIIFMSPINLIFSLFYFLDFGSSSQMFSRNHFNRLSSVSHSWLAMVPKSLMVLFIDFKLFLLWRKSLRIFWRGVQQGAGFEVSHHIPQILIVLSLLHRIRMVCVESRQKILHEAV